MDSSWNWSSRRSPVYAMNGIAASTQPLASEIGVRILQAGGNAADAAVAVAAALNVTEPFSTGVGGDAFCLFYDAKSGKVRGINASFGTLCTYSGRCPGGVSLDVLEGMGYSEAARPPRSSPLFVTVPGAVAGWVDTVEQFGSGNLTLSQILEPGINLAEQGHPVNVFAAHVWSIREADLISASENNGEMLLNGAAPKVGDIMKMPNLAQTFREIAAHGKKGFYEGRIAESILEIVNKSGGIMSAQDLKNHENTFDEPIHVNYRGVDIYEIPPNGQGITALLALNILEGYDLSALEHNSAQHLHYVLEALRLAFADARHYVADPSFSPFPVQGMISKAYAAKRRALIKPDRAASNIEHGFPENSSNTVYFNVVDKDGNACSFINSIYERFGSCLVPKGCGFTLHNRGDNFSLDRQHPNRLEPNKRPYHTIIPGMALKGKELYCAFGVMGAFMQAQGHVQVMSNLIDFNMNPQRALDARRVQIRGGSKDGQIMLEDGIDEAVRAKLESMGHAQPIVVNGWDRLDFGAGQIILRNHTTKVLCAGSDPRHDGCAIGW